VAALDVQKEQGSISTPQAEHAIIARRKDQARTRNNGIKDVSAPYQQQQLPQQPPLQLPLQLPQKEQEQEQGTISGNHYHPDWGKSDFPKLGPIQLAPR